MVAALICTHLFQLYGSRSKYSPSAAGRNGPFSDSIPSSPEQPGPPFVHTRSGASAGATWSLMRCEPETWLGSRATVANAGARTLSSYLAALDEPKEHVSQG